MIIKAIALILTALAARGATITATSAQSTFTVGDVVPVDIVLSSATDVYAFQFDVSFSPTVLSAQDVGEAGYFLSNGVSFSPGTINNLNGTITYITDSLSGNSPTFSGATTLASIRFVAMSPGPATILPSNITLLNSQLSDISVTTGQQLLQVSHNSSVPEPQVYFMVSVGLLLLGILRKSLTRSLLF